MLPNGSGGHVSPSPMRSSALPGTMLGNGPQAPCIHGSFATRRLGISIRPAAVPCIVTAIGLGAKRPAVLGMISVISSTRSSQVLYVSLDAAMVLRVITPHDREGS